MNLTLTLIENTCAVINYQLLMNSFAWMGPYDPNYLYDLQGLYNKYVSLFSLAVRSAWSL